MNYPKKFDNQTKQNAFENACDCLYFGQGPKDWNDCGIPKEERQEVWKAAFWYMAEGI